MKERKYRGFWNDGHDNGEIEYYSVYRNYSKRNMQDMKKSYIRLYGYSAFKYKVFSFGYMINE